MADDSRQDFLTLFEAAKLCPYSEAYLRLRARQGKLKSIKIGKKWMTTKEWVKDYVAGISEGTTLEMVCLADLSPRQFHLAPKGHATFTVLMAMGRYRGRARRTYQEAKEKLAKGWTPDVETARIRDLLRGAPVGRPCPRAREAGPA